MACNKQFTNQVTRSILKIRSPHFYARPLQAWAVRKGLGLVFLSTDRVTRLVNHIIVLLTNNTGLGPGFSHSDWQNSSHGQSNLEPY